MSRFQLRRRRLAARHMCTRCGTTRAKDDCHWCPDCLAVQSAKREVNGEAHQRRRERILMKRQLLLAAVEKFGNA